MESAAAAMGVLHMIRSAVSRPEYWRERYHMSAAPAFLALLNAMMARQPQLHAQVCPQALDPTLPQGQAILKP